MILYVYISTYINVQRMRIYNINIICVKIYNLNNTFKFKFKNNVDDQ